MKKYSFLLILLLFVKVSEAQRFEAGAFVGGNKVVGDVGNPLYLLPGGPTIGGLFKWNTNERLVLRANVYYSIAQGKVRNSTFPYEDLLIGPEDGLSAYSEYNKGVGTGEILFEWNFLPYNLRRRSASTPFAFVGLGAALYEGKFGVSHLGNNVEYIFPIMGEYELTPTVAFGGGYKVKVSPSFVLGAEIGFRYVFSDNLDNSSSVDVGNLNTNDWFTTLGVTLTYVFGRDACACGQ